MANPFPGMDPYLEGDLWLTVQFELCSEIKRQLAPKLRSKYFPMSNRRFVNAPPDELVLPERFQFAAPSCEPIPHVSVEIRDLSVKRVVTCIEVLTPTNKRGPGREEYAARRQGILQSDAHLLEIDFVRVGERFRPGKRLPPSPYVVLLNRAQSREKIEAWPIEIEHPLPVLPVPLLPGDPDCVLDLQQALTTIYEIFGFDELIDYSKEPPGPLTPEQVKWIDERLKGAGRR